MMARIYRPAPNAMQSGKAAPKAPTPPEPMASAPATSTATARSI
jgi:hypothetical protein